MRAGFRRNRTDVAVERARRYLAAWPLPQQAEAHAEAAAGRPEKRERMLADFAAIRAALPFPEPFPEED